MFKRIRAEKPEVNLEEFESGVIETKQAGFVGTVTQKFFDDYNSILMKTIEKNLIGLTLDDSC